MTPEAQDYLDKAREELTEARQILGIRLAKVAARSAYYAAYHAAEAVLAARNGRVAKTHTGVRTALALLLRDAPGTDRDLLTFLARAYKYKEVGDYGVGRNAAITAADAEALLAGAEHFLTRATALIAETAQPENGDAQA